MGRATLVSTIPFFLREYKPGLFPSLYEIPKAPKDGISAVVIEDGYHQMLIPLADDKAPPMRIIDTAERIAESLINDYVGSCLATNYDPNDEGIVAIPGMFWAPGAYYTTEQIKERKLNQSYLNVESHFDAEITYAKKRTIEWFKRLVTLADDDWAKFHQHKMITDIQRGACNYLGLEKEWNFNNVDIRSTLCWACKNSIHPESIICGNCKAIINEKAYSEMKTRFAVTA